MSSCVDIQTGINRKLSSNKGTKAHPETPFYHLRPPPPLFRPLQVNLDLTISVLSFLLSDNALFLRDALINELLDTMDEVCTVSVRARPLKRLVRRNHMGVTGNRRSMIVVIRRCVSQGLSILFVVRQAFVSAEDFTGPTCCRPCCSLRFWLFIVVLVALLMLVTLRIYAVVSPVPWCMLSVSLALPTVHGAFAPTVFAPSIRCAWPTVQRRVVQLRVRGNERAPATQQGSVDAEEARRRLGSGAADRRGSSTRVVLLRVVGYGRFCFERSSELATPPLFFF